MFTRFLHGLNCNLWAATILLNKRGWGSLSGAAEMCLKTEMCPLFLIDFLSDHCPLFSFWRPLGRFLIFGRGLEMKVERE